LGNLVAPRFTEQEFAATARSWDNSDWTAISIHAYLERWGETTGAPEHEEIARVLEKLPAIRVPTTMLHGEDDRDNFPETSTGREVFFTSRYDRILLPNVGHFVPREGP
jgi:pimeloyl-ACP methyl ester carboxylesterase